MKIQIDLKSAVCGMIIGVAAMLAMSADSSSSNSVGRYRIVMGSSAAVGVAVIIDTQIGKVFPQNLNAAWKNADNFWDAK